jgi:Raf kinase inhibitor-like YbhB/YbcL family protein
MRPLWLVVALLLLLGGAAIWLGSGRARRAEAGYHAALSPSIRLSSPAFEDYGLIPTEYSCEGRGGSPPLGWSDLPPGTRSLALIVVDVDIPSSSLRLIQFVHWVLYNIPADVAELEARVSAETLRERGIVAGRNGYGRSHYVDPCPLSGTHTYVYRLYALDVPQIQPARSGKRGVLAAMQGHVLAYGELTGLYAKAN